MKSKFNIGVATICLLLLMLAAWSVPASAAQWLAPAAADRVTAEWVKQIQADLAGERFRRLFMGVPGDPPIPAIVHMLNQADHAIVDNKKAFAKEFIADAIRMLDRGVSRGWYSATDIEPVKAMIRHRADAALNGESISGGLNPRWTGYTENRLLGLTNTMPDKQETMFSKDGAGTVDHPIQQ